MRKIILMMLLAVAPNSVVHAEVSRQESIVYFYGTGQLSCGKWLSARDEKNQDQQALFLQWVAGWISSYDYYSPDRKHGKNIQSPDFETITAFLDTFCKSHPLFTVGFGAAELVEQLGGSKAFHNMPAPRKK